MTKYIAHFRCRYNAIRRWGQKIIISAICLLQASTYAYCIQFFLELQCTIVRHYHIINVIYLVFFCIKSDEYFFDVPMHAYTHIKQVQVSELTEQKKSHLATGCQFAIVARSMGMYAFVSKCMFLVELTHYFWWQQCLSEFKDQVEWKDQENSSA